MYWLNELKNGTNKLFKIILFAKKWASFLLKVSFQFQTVLAWHVQSGHINMCQGLVYLHTVCTQSTEETVLTEWGMFVCYFQFGDGAWRPGQWVWGRGAHGEHHGSSGSGSLPSLSLVPVQSAGAPAIPQVSFVLLFCLSGYRFKYTN